MSSKFVNSNALRQQSVNGPIDILTAGGDVALTMGSAGYVFNEDGGSTLDFRAEGDTLPNLLFIDASADLVYITDAATGGTAPTAPTGSFTTGTLLAIQNNSAASDNAVLALIGGATTGSSGIDFGDSGDANAGSILYSHATDTMTLIAGTVSQVAITASSVIINDGSNDVDVRIEGAADANLVVCDGGSDSVGIGTLAPAAKLEVNQNSATGAIPCLELDQDDADVAFFSVDGTSAADLTANITTLATESVTGHFKILVNGAARWVPFSTTPS